MALIDGLVSYWKLDENAANKTVADSHGANAGTASTNTSNLYDASGKINSSFDFNGTDEVVDTNSFTGITVSPSADMTISAWFNSANDTKGFQRLIDTVNVTDMFEIGFNINATNAWQAFVAKSGSGDIARNANPVVEGAWTHLVIVADGAAKSFEFFQDGESKGGRTYGATVESSNTATNGFAIGAGNLNGIMRSYYEGRIDEVGVWGRKLTSDEVISLNNSGNGLAYPFAAVGINPKVKIAGTFTTKITKVKISDSFVEKPVLVKVGGAFQ